MLKNDNLGFLKKRFTIFEFLCILWPTIFRFSVQFGGTTHQSNTDLGKETQLKMRLDLLFFFSEKSRKLH